MYYWKQFEFTQSYISIFCLLGRHKSRGVSLNAKVTGGSQSSEKIGNCYLQLSAGPKLLSYLVCSATGLQQDMNISSCLS